MTELIPVAKNGSSFPGASGLPLKKNKIKTEYNIYLTLIALGGGGGGGSAAPHTRSA